MRRKDLLLLLLGVVLLSLGLPGFIALIATIRHNSPPTHEHDYQAIQIPDVLVTIVFVAGLMIVLVSAVRVVRAVKAAR